MSHAGYNILLLSMNRSPDRLDFHKYFVAFDMERERVVKASRSGYLKLPSAEYIRAGMSPGFK